MRSHRSMPLVQAMAERKRELQHQGALLEPRASQMVHRRLQNRSVPDPAGGASEITTTTVLLVMAKVTLMTTTKARSTRIANQLGRRSARRYDGETRVSFATDRFVVGIMLFLFEKKNYIKKRKASFSEKKGNRDRGQMTTHKKIELILWIKSGLFFLFFLFIYFFFTSRIGLRYGLKLRLGHCCNGPIRVTRYLSTSMDPMHHQFYALTLDLLLPLELTLEVVYLIDYSFSVHFCIMVLDIPGFLDWTAFGWGLISWMVALLTSC